MTYYTNGFGGDNAYKNIAKYKMAGIDAWVRHLIIVFGYDESSECATARQHKVAEVIACYRLEMNTDGRCSSTSCIDDSWM